MCLSLSITFDLRLALLFQVQREDSEPDTTGLDDLESILLPGKQSLHSLLCANVAYCCDSSQHILSVRSFFPSATDFT